MPLYRHLCSGETPGEVWTFSLWTNGSLSINAAHSAWEAATGTFWSGGIDQHISAQVINTSLSTAEVDVATGRQSQRLESAVNRPGVAAGQMLPFQCATAVSLRTIFATRSGRGRFYLPPLAVSVLLAGRVTPAVQSDLADAAALMLQALAGGGLTPVVYSRTAHAAVTITSIDVGDVIDTQRRRRNKLVEQRESRPI